MLELANRLVPRLGGAEKVLRAARSGRRSGAAPRSFATGGREAAFVVERIARSTTRACRYEEMAILFRTNARSADFEEALTDAGIPFQGAALLARDGAPRLLKALRGSGRLRRDGARIARDQGCSR